MEDSPSKTHNPTNDSDPPDKILLLKQTENGHLEKPFKTILHRRKKTLKDSAFTNDNSSPPQPSSSSSSLRATRVPYKRRHTKVLLPSPARRNLYLRRGDVEAIALPLGISFAAVMAQVLEKNNATGERLSADYLFVLCTSAIRESLSNVFGDKFEFFSRSFEKSFGSTLRTLRLINESSQKDASSFNRLNGDSSPSDSTTNQNVGKTRSSCVEDSYSHAEFSNCSIQDRGNEAKDEEAQIPAEILSRELESHGQIGQLICAPRSLTAVSSRLNALEKSVIEHTRSNDLKEVEIGLTMRRLKLKEAQLALSYDSNDLQRSKIAMGVSKAAFKDEKFKTQLEETRHSELLKKVIDCLVASLFIISASVSLGAYVFSYKRISEATSSCNLIYEESRSWWIPKPMSTFNSGWHNFRCLVQVMSRMMFGLLMILGIAYLLLQRSGNSHQTMPVTFILLLLGVACGFAGKLCVDTLGGNGLHWLLYWEIMCMLHFISIVCTPTLFSLLYGPVTASNGMKSLVQFPYWFRRLLYYALLLVFMPLCCGLLPFAGPGEWKNQFMSFAANLLSTTGD